ncbi:MAG: VOC family protein [Anaerolineales bacterium]|nr:VOC family protein [Anaerolineales bacterium]
MQFSQIHHGSLIVSDLTRAANFYVEVLGLQEIDIPTTFPSAGIHVRWFQIGQQQLHLLQDSTPNAPSRRHIALQVDDAQSARDQLQAKGIAIKETVPIPGADRFFLHDPDGNRLEIIEWQEG